MPVGHRPSKEKEADRNREERQKEQFGHFSTSAEQHIGHDAQANQDGNDGQRADAQSKDNSTIMVSPFDSSASERRLLVSFFCLCCKEDVKTVPPSQCGSDLVQDPNRPFTLITHISAHHHTIDASRICDIGLGYSKPSHTHFDCLRHIFIACHITSNPQIFGTPFDNYRIFGNTTSI